MSQENQLPINDQVNDQIEASIDESRVDAHSASMIDALARRLQAEEFGDDGEVVASEEEGAQAEAYTGPRFEDLGLSPMLCRSLVDSGYTVPTSVQVEAIPAALKGSDLRVASSTGSGKTAAFMLPSLERIIAARVDTTKRREKGKTYGPRVLVLAPTRELAMQVAKAADTYGRHMQGLRVATIVGGVPYAAQLKALRGPLDVLIATPGRLLDHLGTGACVLENLEVLILDEADRMLDMGFIDPIKKIMATVPENRQTLLFSATMPTSIAHLAAGLLRDPVKVEVTPPATTVERISQKVMTLDKSLKKDLLRHVLKAQNIYQALVFTRTKRGADRVADDLATHGIESAAIHGNKSQSQRERALKSFRSGALRVLVATDIAARGLDIPGVSHVINYELPDEPESYVHRIGRTARAGRDGDAIAFMSHDEREQLRDVEKLIGMTIPVDSDQPWHTDIAPLGARAAGQSSKPRYGQRSEGGGQRSQGGRSGSSSGGRSQGGRSGGGYGSSSSGRSPGSRGNYGSSPRSDSPQGPRDANGERRAVTSDRPSSDGAPQRSQGFEQRPRSNDGPRSSGGPGAGRGGSSSASGAGRRDRPRHDGRKKPASSKGPEGDKKGFFSSIKKKFGSW